MKKNCIIIMLAAAATMFVSCNKVQVLTFVEPQDNNGTEVVEEHTVSFQAMPLVGTKTVFGDSDGSTYPTLWTDTEKVEISLNFAAPKDATVVPSLDQTTASLQADFSSDGTGSYTFYALSPKSAYQNSISADSWGFAISTSQTPVTGSVDEKAQVIAAKSSTVTTFPTSPISLSFSHLTAYACMSLKNLVDLGSETINSISIVAGSNIAGRWYYAPSSGALTEWSASNTITVNTSATTNIWFALAPVDLNGKSFKVVVNTTGGTVTKEITWPSGKVFTAGHVAKFNINMSGSPLVTPKVYNLVTDIEDLSNNSKVIIVGASTDYAISTTQNTNNRADAAITKVGTTITDPADNVEVFTVEAGTKSDTYAFLATTESGYIYAASSSGNQMKTGASKTDNSSFSIDINSSTGVATVVAQGTNTRNHIRHNTGMFSCYAEDSSVTEKVAIYKLEGSGDPVKPRVSIAADIEAEVSTDDIIVTWTDPGDSDVDHYVVTCTGQSTLNVDPSDGGCTFENLGNGNYTVTVTSVPIDPSTNRNSNTWTSGTLNVSAGGPTVSTLTFTAACGGSGTADDGAVWTVTSDAAESTFSADDGIHYGTNGASVTYVQLTTSQITGTVSQVVVRTRDARATATVSVTVGGTAYTCSGSTTATNTSADYTFTGSSSGAIVVRVDRGSANTKAIYVKSVTVTH